MRPACACATCGHDVIAFPAHTCACVCVCVLACGFDTRGRAVVGREMRKREWKRNVGCHIDTVASVISALSAWLFVVRRGLVRTTNARSACDAECTAGAPERRPTGCKKRQPRRQRLLPSRARRGAAPRAHVFLVDGCPCLLGSGSSRHNEPVTRFSEAPADLRAATSGPPTLRSQAVSAAGAEKSENRSRRCVGTGLCIRVVDALHLSASSTGVRGSGDTCQQGATEKRHNTQMDCVLGRLGWAHALRSSISAGHLSATVARAFVAAPRATGDSSAAA